MTEEEISALSKAGDVCSPFNGNIVEISVKIGQEVLAGSRVVDLLHNVTNWAKFKIIHF